MTTAAQLQTEFKRMVDDEMFGETIVYVAGGIEYNIRAHVYRKGIVSAQMRFDRAANNQGTESRQSRYDTEIRISSHATEGRAAITIKSDSVKIAKDIGGKVLTMRVSEIIGQDPGTWKLGLSV
jgi:hypothetical protein